MTDKKAVRIAKSLTSDWEKRHLPRIARALPAWLTPDHLTILGVGAALVAGIGYVLSASSPGWLFLSIAALFMNWLGDSLDGTLARVRKQERERYGYYVDRTADVISVLAIACSIGMSRYVSFHVALLVAVGYLLIIIHAEICAYTSQRFPLSIAYLGPTKARIALGLFTLILYLRPPSRAALDIAGMVASGLLFLAFLFLSVREARRLDRLDRLAQVLPNSLRRVDV